MRDYREWEKDYKSSKKEYVIQEAMRYLKLSDYLENTLINDSYDLEEKDKKIEYLEAKIKNLEHMNLSLENELRRERDSKRI